MNYTTNTNDNGNNFNMQNNPPFLNNKIFNGINDLNNLSDDLNNPKNYIGNPYQNDAYNLPINMTNSLDSITLNGTNLEEININNKNKLYNQKNIVDDNKSLIKSLTKEIINNLKGQNSNDNLSEIDCDEKNDYNTKHDYNT